MQKIALLLFVTIMLCGCERHVRIVGRKIRGPFSSKNVIESKSRGAFLFEYEPTTYYLYDSIPIRVLEAFAEYDCWYNDFYSDSVKVNQNSQSIVIQYDENPWPGYYGDTLTFITSKSYINWYLESFSDIRHRSFYHLADGKHVNAPDTLNIEIVEIEQCRDSIYESHYPNYRAVIRKDTIGRLQLIRKRN